MLSTTAEAARAVKTEAEASASPLLSFAEAEQLLESLELGFEFGLCADDSDASAELGSADEAAAPAQTSAHPTPPVISAEAPSVRTQQRTRPLARIEPRPAAAASDAAPTRLAPKDASNDKRRARREMAKQETTYLREQVQKLERELVQLQQQSQQQQQQEEEETDEAHTKCRSLASAAHAWERIAQGQREERRKAEEANAKLRELLEGQLKIATSLQRILRKRPNEPWIENFRLDGDSALTQQLESDGAFDSFEMLLAEIPTLYAQVDATFAETGMAGKTSTFRDVQVKTGARGHMYMEFLDVNILPFDLATTMAAVWKFACLPRADFTNGQYEVIEATDDTVRAQFQASIRLRRARVQIRVNLVMHKVVEADRVVVVWTSAGVSESSLFGSRRFRIREHGRSVATQLPALDASGQAGGGSSSLLRMVLRSAPELQGSISPDEYEQAGVLTDLIVGSYVQNMGVIYQLIENFLMASHLGGDGDT